MNADPQILTAQERLAMSRRALVQQLNGHVDDDDLNAVDFDGAYPPLDAPERAEFITARAAGRNGPISRSMWLPVARSFARRWWQRHPANAVGQLAMPLLTRYAREQPGKLVLGAAATGALVMLIKPWRLLSITAIVAAVLKTSDIAGMVTTLMQPEPSPPRKDLP